MMKIRIFTIFLVIWFLTILCLINDNSKIIQIESLKERSRSFLELKELIRQKDETIKNLLQKSFLFSIDIETLKQKLLNDIHDLSFYVNENLQQMKKTIKNESVSQDILNIENNFKDRINVILAEFFNLSSTSSSVKHHVSNELSRNIQQRFYNLQNPENCSNAKTLICNLNTLRGFGSHFHYLGYCFIEALRLNRTFLFDSENWLYEMNGFEKYFLPLSNTCKVDKIVKNAKKWNGFGDPDNIQSIKLDLPPTYLGNRNHWPLSVPNEYKNDIKVFHGNPFVWWIGQIFKYIMRLQPNFQNEIDETIKKIKFETPCIGIHVRRTDKVGTEATFHYLAEYMKHVDDFYDRIKYIEPNKNINRVVYLATDELTVINETLKYQNYKFIYNIEAIKSANINYRDLDAFIKKRYSPESLRNIIKDIILLSKCDYLICTFSSNVCRLAYELMQTRYQDASWRFKSLDDIYFYDYQNEHIMNAVFKHEPQKSNEIQLKVGDLIGLHGNHWNGYSKGRNHRTNLTGLFPSYKVIDIVQSS